MRVQIITPEKILFEGSASYVQIPGQMGELGVLPNHAPLVSALKDGEIEVSLESGGKETFPIDSGIAEVTPDKVTLLVEKST
ncbi:MAG: ATP synthase F1 subunit epsilon [Rickettsiales bacterium]